MSMLWAGGMFLALVLPLHEQHVSQIQAPTQSLMCMQAPVSPTVSLVHPTVHDAGEYPCAL